MRDLYAALAMGCRKSCDDIQYEWSDETLNLNSAIAAAYKRPWQAEYERWICDLYTGELTLDEWRSRNDLLEEQAW